MKKGILSYVSSGGTDAGMNHWALGCLRLWPANFAKGRAHRIRMIKREFRGGRTVPDWLFDNATYPREIIELSETFWTRVYLALVITRMLVEEGANRVLDVGSGCGKFCIVGALSSSAEFTGIELNPELHQIATRSKEEYEAENASFILGDMVDLDWSKFDSFYLYNPFWEIPGRLRIVNQREEVNRRAETVRAKLDELPVGTRVVTQFGFGGRLSPAYKCVERYGYGSMLSEGCLELWIKKHA